MDLDSKNAPTWNGICGSSIAGLLVRGCGMHNKPPLHASELKKKKIYTYHYTTTEGKPCDKTYGENA